MNGIDLSLRVAVFNFEPTEKEEIQIIPTVIIEKGEISNIVMNGKYTHTFLNKAKEVNF